MIQPQLYAFPLTPLVNNQLDETALGLFSAIRQPTHHGDFGRNTRFSTTPVLA